MIDYFYKYFPKSFYLKSLALYFPSSIFILSHRILLP